MSVRHRIFLFQNFISCLPYLVRACMIMALHNLLLVALNNVELFIFTNIKLIKVGTYKTNSCSPAKN